MTILPLAGRRIAVLLGGVSSEREISLSTGEGVVAAMERLGAEVQAVDAGRDVAAVLAALKPEVAFNALHGVWGEDGCVQGVLETLAIPYTHSGVLASALAMDKEKAKAVLSAACVTVPGGGLFDRREVAARHVLQPPYVVKPNAEGSSVGVIRVLEGANRPPAEVGADDWAYGERVMVEPYIAGRELAVTVVGEAAGPRALAVTDIISASGWYDYESKYGEGGSRHVLPADLPPEITERALRQSEAAHAALGCRGVSRSDLRYDDLKGDLVLLEVNTQPGMTPTSLAPEQAAYAGWSYDRLVLWLVEDASCLR